MKDCLCCLVNVIFLSSDLDYLLSFCIVYLLFKCSNCFCRVFCFCFFCLLFLLLKWLVYIIMFVVFLFFLCYISNFKFIGYCK